MVFGEPPPSFQFTVNHSRSRIRKVYYGGSPHSCLTDRGSRSPPGLPIGSGNAPSPRPSGSKEPMGSRLLIPDPRSSFGTLLATPTAWQLDRQAEKHHALHGFFNTRIVSGRRRNAAFGTFVLFPFPSWDYYGVGFYGEPQKAHLFFFLSLCYLFLFFCLLFSPSRLFASHFEGRLVGGFFFLFLFL